MWANRARAASARYASHTLRLARVGQPGLMSARVLGAHTASAQGAGRRCHQAWAPHPGQGGGVLLGQGRGGDSDEGHVVDEVRVGGHQAALVVLETHAPAAEGSECVARS